MARPLAAGEKAKKLVTINVSRLTRKRIDLPAGARGMTVGEYSDFALRNQIALDEKDLLTKAVVTRARRARSTPSKAT